MTHKGETEKGYFRSFLGSLLVSVALTALFFAACDGGGSGEADTPIKAGGDTSVENRTSFAFEEPAANLSEESLAKHLEGDITFGDIFVTPPAVVNWLDPNSRAMPKSASFTRSSPKSRIFAGLMSR